MQNLVKLFNSFLISKR